MKKNKSNDNFLPYMVIVGVVAIVAIVTLFLWSGRIEGAPIYSYVDEEQVTCLDTDPTNDYYKAGIVRYGKIKYEDYCVDGSLYQHYCETSNDPRLSTPSYTCPYGCLNGACIPR